MVPDGMGVAGVPESVVLLAACWRDLEFWVVYVYKKQVRDT